MNFKIIVDADACPVWRIAERIGAEKNIEVMLICDTTHILNAATAEVIITDKGSDIADFAILNRVKAGDIVITQDYGLAALVLTRKAYVINQNGMEYTNDNIANLLDSRYISGKIRAAGGRTSGPAKRTKEQDKAFIETFEKILKRQCS